MGIIDSVKQWTVSTLSAKGSDFLNAFIQQELALGHQNRLTELVDELIGKNGSIGGVQNLLSKFDNVQLLGSSGSVGLQKNLISTLPY